MNSVSASRAEGLSKTKLRRYAVRMRTPPTLCSLFYIPTHLLEGPADSLLIELSEPIEVVLAEPAKCSTPAQIDDDR